MEELMKRLYFGTGPVPLDDRSRTAAVTLQPDAASCGDGGGTPGGTRNSVGGSQQVKRNLQGPGAHRVSMAGHPPPRPSAKLHIFITLDVAS